MRNSYLNKTDARETDKESILFVLFIKCQKMKVRHNGMCILLCASSLPENGAGETDVLCRPNCRLYRIKCTISTWDWSLQADAENMPLQHNAERNSCASAISAQKICNLAPLTIAS